MHLIDVTKEEVFTLSAKLNKLEKQVTMLKKEVKLIKEQLGFLPPLLSPLEWESLDLLDKKILRLLLKKKGTFISTVKLGAFLHEHRGKIWRHLKKIERISAKMKGEPIVAYYSSKKAWAMNWDEYEFEIPTEMN